MLFSTIGLVISVLVFLIGLGMNVNSNMSPQGNPFMSGLFLSLGLLLSIGFAAELAMKLIDGGGA